MKYFAILIFFAVFVGFSLIADDAYALMIPLSPEELYKQSQTIFVGNITSVNILEFEKSSVSYIEKDGIDAEVTENYTLSLDEYIVNVEEFIKNPQDFSTITVRQPSTSVPGRIIPVGGFELGDRVLFYIQNLDNVNEYSFSSFKIPQQCDPKTVIDQPRIELRNSFEIFQDGIAKNDNFSEEIPMEFVLSKDMDTLYGGSIDVIVSIRKEGENQVLFEKNIHSELERCKWITSAKWEFAPEVGKHRMYLNVKENEKSGGDESYTGFTVVPKSPLKQFNSGIPFEEIQCKENLALIQKNDGSPACVTEATKQKLIERGWTILNQTTNDLLLNHFSNLSEVVAFYEVYEDAEFLLNEDHISYFSGSDDGYFARLNLFFDENYSINGMDFHCYYKRVHQYELPQEDIASKIAEYDCKEHEKFEGPESTITEDETISENLAPYITYDVSGFKQTYMAGEPISFTETIQGFNNPCISTHYEILDGNTLESVWEYKIVYPCPYIRDPQQFKKVISIPNESISSPILNQTGPFIFRSYHSYSDNFTEVKFSVVDLDVDSNKPVPDSGSLFIPQGHVLGDAHEHASILVKIFGDKFDFSNPDFQIRSSWIHFEGLDGNTIHRHSKGVTLGYLFDTLNLKLTSDCFVFVNGREFCTNQGYSLKFFINGIQVDSIRDYVVSQGDRILISYGSEDLKEIQEQFDELNSQEIIN